MQHNRRNYYRILYVQPEAPAEIIAASYRTLMGPLGQHPDRGGCHETAVLLNEAYAVLSDPVRRKAYDRTLRKDLLRRAGSTTTGGATRAPEPHATTATRGAPDSGNCPFCAFSSPRLAKSDGACPRCGVPLTVPPRPPTTMRELFGKRGATRHARTRPVQITPWWGVPPVQAALLDLSLTGLGLLSPRPLAPEHLIRVCGREFDALVEVVACRPKADRHVIHARFVTLRTDPAAGVILSTVA